MNQGPLQDLFLADEPTWEQRWRALSLNMQAWFERRAQANGGEVAREGGMMWTYGPLGESHITISALDVLQSGEQVDRVLEWYRQRHPLRGGLCWYLAAAAPGDLGARLFARGFEPNWQPHWMWLELRSMDRSDVRAATFDMRIVEDESEWSVDDLPYYGAEEAAIIIALRRAYPRSVWHLAAFQRQRVVGRCVLNVTSGTWGVAGLFNMGVVPAVRKQGIGTALVQAACKLAEQRGCRHVVLNATEMGEPVYRRVGFQSMGYGHSWCLRERTLAAVAPTNERVMLLEAIGRGDIATLDEVSEYIEKEAFNEPLPSGLTALDIAVRCQQPASADWLVEHGAQLDLISAWELGWKERIPALLAEQPELVNVQRGDWQLTPLHIAVERDDIELVKLLLTVPNDLGIKDTQFKATALGWAQFFRRSEMIVLIERHSERQRK